MKNQNILGSNTYMTKIYALEASLSLLGLVLFFKKINGIYDIMDMVII